MSFFNLTEELYLYFAISVLLLFYFFLVGLESSWSNKQVQYWLPQDCSFQSLVPLASESNISKFRDWIVSFLFPFDCFSGDFAVVEEEMRSRTGNRRSFRVLNFSLYKILCTFQWTNSRFACYLKFKPLIKFQLP